MAHEHLQGGCQEIAAARPLRPAVKKAPPPELFRRRGGSSALQRAQGLVLEGDILADGFAQQRAAPVHESLGHVVAVFGNVLPGHGALFQHDLLNGDQHGLGLVLVAGQAAEAHHHAVPAFHGGAYAPFILTVDCSGRLCYLKLV